MTRALSSPAGRRVRRLRLRAESTGDAHRASILLNDALRIASMPVAEGGQMLVVRRLPLGRISVQSSAATLALQLERAMREAHLRAVPFDLPAASDADAVLVRSAAEAIAYLARLHARGDIPREWFWSAIVPAWRVDRSRGERWLLLLEAAHDLPEAALAVAMIVKEAVRAGSENELFCALPPGRDRDWLQLAGWSVADVPGAAAPEISLDPKHELIVRQWARRWGPTSGRLIWVATMLAVVEKPARVADTRLPTRVAAAVNKVVERELHSTGPPAVHTVAPAPAAAEALGELDQSKRNETGPVQNARPDDSSPQSIQPHGVGDPSNFAGLLFLVPILERLDFAEALAAQPALIECEFSARLLLYVGGRVGLPNVDPLATALEVFDPAVPLPDVWEMPEPAYEELAFPRLRKPLDSPLLAWLTALRRWSRRHARLGLVSLICRPGEVAASRTHLDISFPLSEADVRLRRLALDVDPGWVPWLGRVVRFHYQENS